MQFNAPGKGFQVFSNDAKLFLESMILPTFVCIKGGMIIKGVENWRPELINFSREGCK